MSKSNKTITAKGIVGTMSIFEDCLRIDFDVEDPYPIHYTESGLRNSIKTDVDHRGEWQRRLDFLLENRDKERARWTFEFRRAHGIACPIVECDHVRILRDGKFEADYTRRGCCGIIPKWVSKKAEEILEENARQEKPKAIAVQGKVTCMSGHHVAIELRKHSLKLNQPVWISTEPPKE